MDPPIICHNIDCRSEGRVIRVDNNDTYIACGKCKSTYHGKCVPVTLTAGTIKDLAANVGGLYWVCGSCNPAVKLLLANLDATNKRCDEIEAKFDNLSLSLGAKIDAISEKISVAPPPTFDSNTAHQNSDTTVEAVREMQDIKRRKGNLMIFKLVLPPNPPAADVKNLVEELLIGIGLQPSEHEFIFVGQVGREVAGRARAIKVVFKSKASARAVLGNANKLANIGDTRFSKISIRPDLTPLQQAENKKLAEELRLKKSGGGGYHIRRGRVVATDGLASDGAASGDGQSGQGRGAVGPSGGSTSAGGGPLGPL